MSYIKSNLLPNEQVIFEAKLHCIIFLKPIFIAIVGFLLLIWESGTVAIASVIILVGVIYFFISLLSKMTTEFAVTNKRVIGKYGIISRHTLDINLSKVEGVNLDQGIIGNLLGYGSISVRGTGAGVQTFPYIEQPMEFQKRINQAVETVQTK